jgi:hypothetical protein
MPYMTSSLNQPKNNMQYTVIRTQQFGVAEATDPDDAIQQVLAGKASAGTASYNATPRPVQPERLITKPGGPGGQA